MKVEWVKIESLKPYEKNSRIHSKEQVKQIADSIAAFGFNNPLLISEKNDIIAGHGRLEGAKLLKHEEVPCIRLSHLTEKQRRAYLIADNKIALNSSWDMVALNFELADLKDDFDLSVLGWSETELDLDLGGNAQGTEDFYTKKIVSPIYTPTMQKPPEIDELADTTVTKRLLSEIDAAQIPVEVSRFLKLAAYRHTEFNYQNIAEYYAHAPKHIQELMENSALVIIDFKKAIELGFVKLREDIAEAYINDNPDA